MKIRQGFVSNSSSSNFILAFDKKPESVGKLRNLMFGDQETFVYDSDYGPYNTIDIAKAVFNQLNKELTLDEILEEFISGWLDGVTIDDIDDSPDYWIKDKNDNNKMIPNPEYEQYQKSRAEKENIRALEYFNAWKCPDDQVFFCVKFADDNGSFEATCEHGGIFRNIHHVQISHH